MKPRTRDLLVYVITSLAILIGFVGLVQAISLSRVVPSPESPEGFDEFQRLHVRAFGWLAVSAAGAFFLAIYMTVKEIPMWKMRQQGLGRHRRSSLAVSLGLGIAILGLGAAAIMYHQTYAMPASVPDYQETFDSLNERAKLRVIVGLVGAVVFTLGVLFIREPDLEFEESLVYKRPVWHGALVMVLGMAVGAVFWYYGAVSYDDYYERDETLPLTIIMMAGLGIAFFVFIIGLFMWGRSAPLVSYQYRLRSGDQDRGKGE